MNIAVITTFPSNMWDVYAKQMLTSFVQYWPKEIPILIALDDDLLKPDVDRLMRDNDACVIGWDQDHTDFVARNKSKDNAQDYRKQATKFCHKVFAIKHALDAVMRQKEVEAAPRYLIWMDADVVTTKHVSLDDIKKCLPKEGDAVSYLGRKDWDHSECGWLAFDLENGSDRIIQDVHGQYISDTIFQQLQWHDSWIWDLYLKNKCTNLTADKPGMEIWPQSPMAAWSIHYKGPAAKQKLIHNPVRQPLNTGGKNVIIQTKNAIPAEEICDHIRENQRLITNWLRECEPNNEKITIVSAGPMLFAEDVRVETGKIVAVKHALQPLKKAGIKPWACILLDPRPHVADFVQEADPEVLWFVASQVNPEVTKLLLDKGCEVWGYHASVGAGESELTDKQPNSIVSGGSATATRGLFLLAHLGFRDFHLYGYDLSFPDKMDMHAKDSLGQPKYLEFSVGTKNAHVDVKKCFYSEPQLIAQFEELNEIMKEGKYKLKAFGHGMLPFILKLMEVTNLRQDELKYKMGGKLSSYELLWNKTKKTKSSATWRRISSKIRRKPMASIR